MGILAASPIVHHFLCFTSLYKLLHDLHNVRHDIKEVSSISKDMYLYIYIYSFFDLSMSFKLSKFIKDSKKTVYQTSLLCFNLYFSGLNILFDA